jgi:hypothetical protein
VGTGVTSKVAALFVDPKGVYSGLEDVEVWDEARDARSYEGPWPAAAHPPCNRWSILAALNQRHGYEIGADEGCFASALASVRRWGGVLEHPANSFAWARFGLPVPVRFGWAGSLTDQGLTTEVDQGVYGHPCRKRTWLYYVGPNPIELDWREATDATQIVSDLGPGGSRRRGADWKPGVQYGAASATPEAFARMLVTLARTATVATADHVATLGNRA